MPVAVYDGTDVGGVDAFSDQIPQKGVLTHGHLDENKITAATPRPAGPEDRCRVSRPLDPIGIEEYDVRAGRPVRERVAPRTRRGHAGQSLTFKNLDATPGREHLPHDHRRARRRATAHTGIAYPIANGPSTFDSGQLGFNYAGFNAPAVDRDTWRRRRTSRPGTYSYFCRVHPFMRGSFRVVSPN